MHVLSAAATRVRTECTPRDEKFRAPSSVFDDDENALDLKLTRRSNLCPGGCFVVLPASGRCSTCDD